MNNLEEIRKRVTEIKLFLDGLHYQFYNDDNKDEFETELADAELCLESAIEIIERDIAYRDINQTTKSNVVSS